MAPGEDTAALLSLQRQPLRASSSILSTLPVVYADASSAQLSGAVTIQERMSRHLAVSPASRSKRTSEFLLTPVSKRPKPLHNG